ncbi:MAG: bifunctional oligoribonuclease/PAP phosphatase NrnA [Defluviitaleaceae bacterium]|nr:bifunctional oligoribonuclease/PAP phosphatase NrnA [Defluviitaleaceae bacterium]
MDEILQVIRENENFTLAGHTGPDGDAIGSCFALALALDKMGKNVRVLLEPYALKYKIIPGKQFLVPMKCNPNDPTKSESIFDLEENFQPEVFIAIDCAAPERMGLSQPFFERAKVTVCIDHHETNDGFAMHNYIEPTASSASEMTLRIIEGFTDPTPDIAAAVYAGMVSDTGGFRYNATAISTMKTAARLMEMGIPFTQIYNELMHMHKFAAGKILGLALQNSKRTRSKKIVYTCVTRDMLKSVRANLSDLDGVVEYLMGTRKALAAVFVYEKGLSSGEVKVSLRSQGPNMANVAAKLGGGGHALAAGATVSGKVHAVMKKTVALVVKEVVAYEVQQNRNN